jgi:hypothetical protein
MIVGGHARIGRKARRSLVRNAFVVDVPLTRGFLPKAPGCPAVSVQFRGWCAREYAPIRTHAALDSQERKKNNVRSSFHQGRVTMFRAVVEEAAALASISLFIGMIAVWVQVFSAI